MPFFEESSCGWRIVISLIIRWNFPSCYDSVMRDLVVLFIHFIASLARLLGPGGARSLVAESLLLKHQLLILNRSRQRAPNLSASDRILAGWLALWLRPTRLLRSAIVLKPSTLIGLHQAMCKQKYRMLFSPNHNRKPGPKGPSAELINAVVEMKQRNPRWGCPRIAEQIALAFNVAIDKDVVRRILAHRYWPGGDATGPSWLTFLGQIKDSLWSMDLFRCESVTLRTHWVLVVMDQYTRRIIGFGVHAGTVDGVALCRMFNRAIRGQGWLPKYLSSDHDPLYKFHQWQANLRILEVTEIKTVPYVPLSHPFVERLIGTIRREYLDHMVFWTSADLENKLLDFRTYYNHHRTHHSREGRTPETPAPQPVANLRSFRWQAHCRALYQTPVAA
jgi:putative transposase